MLRSSLIGHNAAESFPPAPEDGKGVVEVRIFNGHGKPPKIVKHEVHWTPAAKPAGS